MTTDRGIDLVAFSERRNRTFTIQVKSNLIPKPGGGNGSPALDWWVNEDCPAELYAFVHIDGNEAWLLTREELALLAQQRPEGRYHIFMYLQMPERGTKHARATVEHFQDFVLERRIGKLL